MRFLIALLVVAAADVAHAASVQVTAAIAEDDATQTKYNVLVRNTGTSALTGFSARVYVDLSEVFAAGKTATCVERYDPASSTCTLVAHSGNVYYARLDYGSYSLAAGASLEYKITVRTSDFSSSWSSANDDSRAGLTSSHAITTWIPVYQGSTRIYGSDPGGSTSPTATPSRTPTPRATARPVFSQTFDSLSTGSRWLSSCKWNKHTTVADGCGVTSKCLRIKQDPFCKEPPLFPLPPVDERPSYPNGPPCEVCSPYYTNTGTDVVQAVQPITLGDEYSLNYDLYFEPGYDWARGGKLPGLSGKEWDSGCSIEGDGLPTDPGPARWSVRLMWRANGTNELYVYDQNRLPGACGTRSPTPVTFTTGRWYAITIYVKLNTTATSTDGIAALYIDGQVARQETGIRFRAETSSSSRINQIFFSTFYGGNESKRLYCLSHPGSSPYCTVPDPTPDKTWVPQNVTYLRFDNMAVYPGLRVRGTAGQ